MLSRSVQVFVGLIGILLLAPPAMAQRGAGEAAGMARRAVKPPIIELTGTVQRIVTEDCKYTTGRAEVGTHFLMKSPDGKELNVHLGPAQLVKEDAAKLEVGTTVSARGFHTDAMAEGHYNAVTVQVGDAALRLRGENLRPRWAGTVAPSAQRPRRAPRPSQPPAMSEGVYFPEGDPMAGRLAVAKMQCHACHQIAGADFPPPVASPPVPVPLGAAQASQPRAKLAESIIAPSHVVPANVPDTVEGGLSRMADYNQCMSVRELIDMVAYIKTLPDAKIEKPNGATGGSAAAAGAGR